MRHIVFGLLLFLCLPRAGWACECIRIDAAGNTVPEGTPNVDDYQAVFTGEVVYQSLSWEGESFEEPKEATQQVEIMIFRVTEVWKGPHAPTAWLIQDLSTCEYPFQEGGRYVVFAHAMNPAIAQGLDLSSGGLTADQCSPTRPLGDTDVASWLGREPTWRSPPAIDRKQE